MSGYRDITCDKCGHAYFKTPLEGLIAKKQYTVCTKCGHKQMLKPGDMYKTEFAEEKEDGSNTETGDE